MKTKPVSKQKNGERPKKVAPRAAEVRNASFWVEFNQNKRHQGAFRVLLAIISLTIFSNALNCGFVYDDHKAILENRNAQVNSPTELLSPSSWIQLFTDDFWGTPIGNAGSHKSFRPLVTLSFKVQHLIGRLPLLRHLLVSGDDAQLDDDQASAFSFHLVNVILHTCVVDLVFQLAGTKFNIVREDARDQINGQVAVLGSLLFACHPIHVEAVTSLVGRAELMGTLFALLSFKHMFRYLLQWQESDNGKFHSIESTCFAALACLCKENCASVILINLMLIAWFSLRRRGKNKLQGLKPTGATIAMFTVLCLLIGHRKVIQEDGFWPKFSSLDNPLAMDSRQFCLKHASQLEDLHEAGTKNSESDSESTSVQHEQLLNERCSSPQRLSLIDLQIKLTRLYLPAFSVSLLAYPNELSYDWPLETIRLITSPLEMRFLISLAVYLILVVFLGCWLRDLFFAADCSPNRMSQCNLIPSPVRETRKFGRGNNKTTESFAGHGKTSALTATIDEMMGLSGGACNSGGGNGSDSETSSVTSVDTMRSCDSGFVDSAANGSPCNLNSGDNSARSSPDIAGAITSLVTRLATDDGSNYGDHHQWPANKRRPPVSGQVFMDSVGWSIILAVVPYLPASNLLFPVGFLVAERTLYLPSVGFCLLASHVIVGSGETKGHQSRVELKNDKKKSSQLWRQMVFKWQAATTLNITAKLALIFPLLIWAASKTHERNSAWATDRSLYSSNVAQSPAKSLANLAGLPGAPNQLPSSSAAYREALKREPHSAELHYNLALALQREHYDDAEVGQSRRSQPDLTEYHYKQALKLRPNFPLAALNLGAHQFERKGQLAEARETFEFCANQTDAKRSKSFRQHVHVQIECLISLIKLEQTSSRRPASCARVFKFAKTARELAQNKLGLGQAIASRTVVHQIEADLSKQMASIYWLESKCTPAKVSNMQDSSPISDENGGRLKLLEVAAQFAGQSQVSSRAQIYMDYASALVEESQAKRAILMLERALEVEARKKLWRRPAELAQLHLKLAKLTQQNHHCEQAMRLDENNVSLVSFCAQLAHDLRHFKLSEQLYARALDLLPERSENKRKLASAHVNFGAILQVNGEQARAKEHYRRALDWDPENSFALRNLAKLGQRV